MLLLFAYFQNRVCDIYFKLLIFDSEFGLLTLSFSSILFIVSLSLLAKDCLNFTSYEHKTS